MSNEVIYIVFDLNQAWVAEARAFLDANSRVPVRLEPVSRGNAMTISRTIRTLGTVSSFLYADKIPAVLSRNLGRIPQFKVGSQEQLLEFFAAELGISLGADESKDTSSGESSDASSDAGSPGVDAYLSGYPDGTPSAGHQGSPQIPQSPGVQTPPSTGIQTPPSAPASHPSGYREVRPQHTVTQRLVQDPIVGASSSAEAQASAQASSSTQVAQPTSGSVQAQGVQSTVGVQESSAQSDTPTFHFNSAQEVATQLQTLAGSGGLTPTVFTPLVGAILELVKRLEADLSRASGVSDEEVVSLRSQLASFEGQLSSLRAQHETVLEDLSIAKQSVANLTADKQDLRAENESLRGAANARVTTPVAPPSGVSFVATASQTEVIPSLVYLLRSRPNTVIVDLSAEALLDTLVRFTNPIRPTKWLLDGLSPRVCLAAFEPNKVSLASGLGIIASPGVILEDNILELIDWNRVFQSLRDLDTPDVVFYLGVVSDGRVMDFASRLQSDLTVLGAEGSPLAQRAFTKFKYAHESARLVSFKV